MGGTHLGHAHSVEAGGCGRSGLPEPGCQNRAGDRKLARGALHGWELDLSARGQGREKSLVQAPSLRKQVSRKTKSL